MIYLLKWKEYNSDLKLVSEFNVKNWFILEITRNQQSELLESCGFWSAKYTHIPTQ